MRKDYLLTPGPSMVPERVLLSMAGPMIHHRTPRFQAILKEAIERSKRVLLTQNDLAIFTSSGTGAMEAAVANLASPGLESGTGGAGHKLPGFESGTGGAGHKLPGFESGTGGAGRKLPGFESGTGGAGRKLPGFESGTGGAGGKLPGRRALTIESGKFGERWGELCRAFGFEHEAVAVEWGKAVDPKIVEAKLAADPSIKAVFATHCETSTGTLHDIKALGAITAKTDAVLVVDAISSAPGNELRTDEWGVDVVIVGSQKALMLPPGLAMITASAKAKALMDSAENRRVYYFDLLKAFKSAAENDTPYTPAITLVIGLNEALKMIEEEGLEECFRRHATLAEAVRAGAGALGLELFSERPSNTVTAIRMPEGVDGAALVKRLRDVEGVALAGGQDQLKGKIVRIATMGYCAKYDVIVALGALEMALAAAGHEVTLGAGVAAAEEVFLEEMKK